MERVVARLRGSVPMTGFLTGEIRRGARRIGFGGTTLDGKTFALAGVGPAGAAGGVRVGPYVVTTDELDAVGVPALDPRGDARLVVLDEVGKMESFSGAFRDAVNRLLDGDAAVLGTVAAHGVGFPKKVRNDPRVTLVRMRRESRDGVVGEILRRLAEAGIAPGGRSRPRPEAR